MLRIFNKNDRNLYFDLILKIYGAILMLIFYILVQFLPQQNLFQCLGSRNSFLPFLKLINLNQNKLLYIQRIIVINFLVHQIILLLKLNQFIMKTHKHKIAIWDSRYQSAKKKSKGKRTQSQQSNSRKVRNSKNTIKSEQQIYDEIQYRQKNINFNKYNDVCLQKQLPKYPNRCYKKQKMRQQIETKKKNKLKELNNKSCTKSKNQILKQQIKNQMELNIKDSNDIIEKNNLKTHFMIKVQISFKQNKIFDAETLDQKILQSWGNDQILYFFGPIFHKIRLKKQKMNYYQFFKEVEKIYESFSLKDIKKCFQILDSKISDKNSKKQSRIQKYKIQQNVPNESGGQQQTPLFKNNVTNKENTSNSHYQSKFEPSNIEKSRYFQKKIESFGDIQLKQSRNQDSPVQKQSKIQKRIIFGEQSQKSGTYQFPLKQSTSIQNKAINVYNKNQYQQNKLSDLSKKLEYFIQRNNKHLEISKNIRIQNGF